MSENRDDIIRAKLEELADLEEEHNLRGASIQADHRLSLEDGVDIALELTKTTIDVITKRKAGLIPTL